MKEGKISCPQLVMLLFLSRMFTVLEETPVLDRMVTGTTLLWSIALGFLMQCVLAIPMLLLLYRYRGQNIINCAFLVSPAVGRLSAGIFLFYLMIRLAGSFAGFSFFITNITYPESSALPIILVLALVCTICVCYGLQGIARAASIVFVLFLLGAVFLSLAASKNAALLNIHRMPGDDFFSIMEGALNNTAKNAELFLLPLLLPSLVKQEKMKSCTYWYLLLSFLFIELTQLLILAVLGDFGMAQTFPYYALVSIIDVSIFQRLDSLHVVLWIFVALFHCALYMLCAVRCTARLFSEKIARWSPLFIALVSGGTGVFLAEHMQLLQGKTTSGGLLVILFSAVFPLILFIILHWKEKRHAPNQGRSAVPRA